MEWKGPLLPPLHHPFSVGREEKQLRVFSLMFLRTFGWVNEEGGLTKDTK